MSVSVSMTVNGEEASAAVESRTLLVHFLREQLRLTGTHVGCDTSQCGACVVHVNGRSVKSCTLLAVQAEGLRCLRSKGSRRGKSFIQCKPPSRSATAFNAASVRPGW